MAGSRCAWNGPCCRTDEAGGTGATASNRQPRDSISSGQPRTALVAGQTHHLSICCFPVWVLPAVPPRISRAESTPYCVGTLLALGGWVVGRTFQHPTTLSRYCDKARREYRIKRKACNSELTGFPILRPRQSGCFISALCRILSHSQTTGPEKSLSPVLHSPRPPLPARQFPVRHVESVKSSSR